MNKFVNILRDVWTGGSGGRARTNPHLPSRSQSGIQLHVLQLNSDVPKAK